MRRSSTGAGTEAQSPRSRTYNRCETCAAAARSSAASAGLGSKGNPTSATFSFAAPCDMPLGCASCRLRFFIEAITRGRDEMKLELETSSRASQTLTQVPAFKSLCAFRSLHSIRLFTNSGGRRPRSRSATQQLGFWVTTGGCRVSRSALERPAWAAHRRRGDEGRDPTLTQHQSPNATRWRGPGAPRATSAPSVHERPNRKRT